MKHTHHLPSAEFPFFPVHFSYLTGKWPHAFCHFLAPFKQLPFCFLILQDRKKKVMRHCQFCQCDTRFYSFILSCMQTDLGNPSRSCVTSSYLRQICKKTSMESLAYQHAHKTYGEKEICASEHGGVRFT